MKLISPKDCSLKNQLKECYQAKNYSDVTLLVENQRLLSHRTLLASSSSLLNGILRYFRNSENVDILLEGFRIDSIKKVLEFLYTGEVFLRDEELSDFQSSLNALGLESASTQVELAEGETVQRDFHISQLPQNGAAPSIDALCAETSKDVLTTQTNDAQRKRPRKKLDSEKSNSSSSSPAQKKSHQSITGVSRSSDGSTRSSSPDIEMLVHIPANTKIASNGSSTLSQSDKQLTPLQLLKKSKSKFVSIQNAALKKAANCANIDNDGASLDQKKRPVSNTSRSPERKKVIRRTGELSINVGMETCSTKSGQCQPTSEKSAQSQYETLPVMRNHSEKEVLTQIGSGVNATSKTSLPAASCNLAALTCRVSDESPVASGSQVTKSSISVVQSVSVPTSADFVSQAVEGITTAPASTLSSNAVAPSPIVILSNSVDDKTLKTVARLQSSIASAVDSSVAASNATTKWVLCPVYSATKTARSTTDSSRSDDPARLETPRLAVGLPFARLATLGPQQTNLANPQAGMPTSQSTTSPVEIPQLPNRNRSAGRTDRSNGQCKATGKSPAIIELTKDSVNNRSRAATAEAPPHAKQHQTEPLECSTSLNIVVQPDFATTVNPLGAHPERTRSDPVLIAQRPRLPSVSCIENQELQGNVSSNPGNSCVDITVDDVLCQLDSEFAPLRRENQENTPVPRKVNSKKIYIKTCRTCKVEIKGDKNYKDHLKAHRMENPFPCRICPVRLKTKSSLRSHEKRKHDISQLKCIVCGIKFLGRMHREQHIFACVAQAAGSAHPSGTALTPPALTVGSMQLNQPVNENAQDT